LTNAIHLARNFEAELTVFTAIEPLSNIYQTLVKVPAKLGSTYKKDQKAQFERFMDDFDFHNVQWKKAVCEGNPPEEILNAARTPKSDLIVMGSQGRTGVARMLIGSVAEKVIREMPCSVVTVKTEHAIRLRLETEIADLEARFKAGQELLDKGFPAEALRQFEGVVTKDMTFAPGWEGLAVAHNRLGQKEEAKECKQRAQHIRKKLWEKRVEAEIRAKHVLWGKKSKKF
jgi:nucleotide-binding universal stress UspA family protein